MIIMKKMILNKTKKDIMGLKNLRKLNSSILEERIDN